MSVCKTSVADFSNRQETKVSYWNHSGYYSKSVEPKHTEWKNSTSLPKFCLTFLSFGYLLLRILWFFYLVLSAHIVFCITHCIYRKFWSRILCVMGSLDRDLTNTLVSYWLTKSPLTAHRTSLDVGLYINCADDIISSLSVNYWSTVGQPPVVYQPTVSPVSVDSQARVDPSIKFVTL